MSIKYLIQLQECQKIKKSSSMYIADHSYAVRSCLPYCSCFLDCTCLLTKLHFICLVNVVQRMCNTHHFYMSYSLQTQLYKS